MIPTRQAALEHGLAEIQDIIDHSYLREAGRFRQIEEAFNKHLRGLNIAAVELAAPCSECEEYGEPCWRHTPPGEQAAPEKDFVRGYKEIGLDLDALALDAARAALRGAAPLVLHGALFTHASVSQEAACPVCQWLAMPAVVAAMKEEST